jgi:uncharacterized protein (UPF0335 family)
MTDEFDPTAVRAFKGSSSRPKASGQSAGGRAGTPAAGNSPAAGTGMTKSKSGDGGRANGIARDQLRAFVERIERLEEEKKSISDDIKDVYSEAKGTGFDTKALRKVIALRKLDPDERAEQEAILDTYLIALGMMVGGAE